MKTKRKRRKGRHQYKPNLPRCRWQPTPPWGYYAIECKPRDWSHGKSKRRWYRIFNNRRGFDIGWRQEIKWRDPMVLLTGYDPENKKLCQYVSDANNSGRIICQVEYQPYPGKRGGPCYWCQQSKQQHRAIGALRLGNKKPPARAFTRKKPRLPARRYFHTCVWGGKVVELLDYHTRKRVHLTRAEAYKEMYESPLMLRIHVDFVEPEADETPGVTHPSNLPEVYLDDSEKDMAAPASSVTPLPDTPDDWTELDLSVDD